MAARTAATSSLTFSTLGVFRDSQGSIASGEATVRVPHGTRSVVAVRRRGPGTPTRALTFHVSQCRLDVATCGISGQVVSRARTRSACSCWVQREPVRRDAPSPVCRAFLNGAPDAKEGVTASSSDLPPSGLGWCAALRRLPRHRGCPYSARRRAEALGRSLFRDPELAPNQSPARFLGSSVGNGRTLHVRQRG